jgi:hypothetical protein
VTELERRAREFFDAYATGDVDAVRGALADDLVSYVTNAEGAPTPSTAPTPTWRACRA